MDSPKIGLLLLYLELYDKSMPQIRGEVEKFADTIRNEFIKRKVSVVLSPVCRIKPEFDEAVKNFEAEGVDIIVTLHLAYSPSLESYEALVSTDLPVVVLNTTPSYAFDNTTPEAEIMFNHGIHGVQDLCNLLKRNHKEYHIETGHWLKSDVIDRVASWARAAKMASKIKTSRIGILGMPFKGMGDFAVPFDELKKNIGINTIEFDLDDGRALAESISEKEILEEMEADRKRFITAGINEGTHYKSVRAGLALRKWIDQSDLDGFTVNFLSIRKDSPINVMPFLEIEKQMARGIGYAGEGDVLTAALSAALASGFEETSFTEMFCPDWKSNTIFLSHMGEMNISLTSSKPELIEKDFPYTDADNPAVASGLFKPGRAAIVNLAPAPDGGYALIIAKGEMIDISGEDMLKNSIHGWFRPDSGIEDFLTEFSMAGGTHHSVLCYTTEADIIKKFGKLMGWDTVLI